LTRSNPDEEKKSAFFLNAAGKNAYKLIKNLAYPSLPVSVPYDDLKSLLLQHVKPTNFEASERAKFHSMVRNPNQGIPEFILDLLTQAAKCDFGDLLDMQLKDRLIAGINNTVLQNELLKLSNPTFKDVRAYCEQYQDIRAATSSMPSTIGSTAMFNSLKTKSTKAHA
uniref:Retrotrans_gag domain-containing protein n=1 Tax=Echinostoma caproni TaxID=27848 RepID=A0A183A0T2_9TREM